jgi:hypothetical protein
VYAFTEVMDGSKYALFWEVIKNVFGILIIFLFDDWFGVSKVSPSVNYILLVYFAISSFASLWLLQQNKKPAVIA